PRRAADHAYANPTIPAPTTPTSSTEATCGIGTIIAHLDDRRRKPPAPPRGRVAGARQRRLEDWEVFFDSRHRSGGVLRRVIPAPQRHGRLVMGKFPAPLHPLPCPRVALEVEGA